MSFPLQATGNNKHAVVQLLLHAGADSNNGIKNGETPLTQGMTTMTTLLSKLTDFLPIVASKRKK